MSNFPDGFPHSTSPVLWWHCNQCRLSLIISHRRIYNHLSVKLRPFLSSTIDNIQKAEKKWLPSPEGLICISAYRRNLENRSNLEIPLYKGNPQIIELCSGNVACEEEGLCNRTGVLWREASTSHNDYSCRWLLGSLKRQGIKVAPT